MTNLIATWQSCSIYLSGRSHQCFYYNTVQKSLHFEYKYLLPLLPYAKYMHPPLHVQSIMESGSGLIVFVSPLNVALLTQRPVSYKGNLSVSQSVYIMERGRISPINTTIQKREECEVLSDHGFRVILKSFCVDVIRDSSTQDM